MSLLPAPVFYIVIIVTVLMLQPTDAKNAKTDKCEAPGEAPGASSRFPIIADWVRWITQSEFGLRVLLAAFGVLLVAGIVAAVVAVRLYRLLLRPLDRVRLLGEVGYVCDGRQSTKDVVEQVRRRRAVGDVPPVYPNGWFALIESHCLRVGQAKNVCCVGKHYPPTRSSFVDDVDMSKTRTHQEMR